MRISPPQQAVTFATLGSGLLVGCVYEQLDALPEDPFVRYARKGHHGPELGELEFRIQPTLDQLIERVEEELTARRQLAGVPKK